MVERRRQKHQLGTDNVSSNNDGLLKLVRMCDDFHVIFILHCYIGHNV